MDNEDLSEGILEHLKECYTSEITAIKSRDLCELFCITGRQLRNIVSGLRRRGEAVCSSTNGYWYSTDPEDIGITLRRLEEQIRNMTYSVEGLQSVLAGGIKE